MNLLEKANIITTATAYDNGKLHSVKGGEVADFDVVRGSAATRVNAEGLIEDISVLSGELVSDGSFDAEGVEQITNGSFDTDTNWTTNTGWSISGGSATCDGTQGGNTTLVQQNGIKSAVIDFVVGKTYKVNFDIVVTSGQIANVEVASGYDSNNITTSGNHTTYITAVSTNDRFTITANPSFTGSIDNISVKEVAADWTLGTGWSISDGKAVANLTTNAQLTQSSVFTSGKNYKVSFEISDYTSGSINLSLHTRWSEAYSANGVYTEYFTAAQTLLKFESLPDSFVGSIDNISVKEVAADWNLLNAELTDNAVVIGRADGSISQFGQSGILTIGKQYKLSYDVLEDNGGAFNLASPTTALVTTLGSHTVYFEANGVDLFVKRASPSTTTKTTFTNISVVEIIDATNIPRIDYTTGEGVVLLEPQSTNLITHSEDFSQWTQANYTVQTNVAVSPSGNFDASFLINSSGVGGLIKQNIPVTALTTYTFSFYAKRGTSSDAKYSVYDNTNAGDIISSTSYYSQINSDTFTRVAVSFTAPAGCASVGMYVLRDSLAAGNTIIWGAQLEALPYATSYIPTSGAIATRLADSVTGAGDATTFNSTEGVLYFEGGFKQTSLTNGLFALSDGIFSNYLMVRFSPTNKIQVETSGGVNLLEGSSRASGNYKIAVKYSSSGVELWVDGFKVVETSTQPSISNINELMIGKSPFGNIVGCTVKALAVFNEALTDSELECLTTI